MTAGYVYHPMFLQHDLRGHPENSERLRMIWSRLEASGLLPLLIPIEPRPVDVELLCSVHAQSYVEHVEHLAAAGGGYLDMDTYLTGQSYQVARLAAGGVVEAVSAVLDGKVESVFALVRPPGHHARPAQGMGFCLFNNVAVAARYALDKRGLHRVLIVDFDVHHGNGTQDIFYDSDAVLYFSTHQYPHYPGTGHWTEVGTGPGKGFTVNVPLPYGAGDRAFRHIFEQLLAPISRRYQPQLILVSAGFDAHWNDPLAALNLTLAGYAWICEFLLQLAGELCDGRIVFALEGGYHLNVLAHAVLNAFRILLRLDDQHLVDPFGPSTHEETPVDNLINQLCALHGLG